MGHFYQIRLTWKTVPHSIPMWIDCECILCQVGQITYLFIDHSMYPRFIINCILHHSKPGSSKFSAVRQDVLVNFAHLSNNANQFNLCFPLCVIFHALSNDNKSGGQMM